MFNEIVSIPHLLNFFAKPCILFENLLVMLVFVKLLPHPTELVLELCF